MTDGMLIKEYGGFDIFLEEGKFVANLNGRLVRRSALSDLEKQIDADAAPQKAIYFVDRYSGGIRDAVPIEISGVSTTGGHERFRVKGGGLLDRWADLREYNEEALLVLEDFTRRRNELTREFTEYVRALPHFRFQRVAKVTMKKERD